jgi:DNA-binding NtrC family response regulator
MHFVEIYSQRMGKHIERVSPETMKAFRSYAWPGNIRELQNLVERAVINSSDATLANPFADDDGEFDDSAEYGPSASGMRHASRRSSSVIGMTRMTAAPQAPSLKQQSSEVVPLRFRA